MKKLTQVLLSTVLTVTMFSGLAEAHVTVQPREVTQGSYEVFTVRVPSEKDDTPTMKVEVKFPEGVSVSRFEPKPGWSYEVEENDDGRIEGVRWSATGEGLAPIEFAQFTFQGRVNDDATDLIWKAYQTYGDGDVVDWVGAEGSETPASVTTVKPLPAGQAADDHDHETAGAAVEGVETTNGGGSNASLLLSIAALVLGLIALGMSFRKRA
ncbi:nuclear export factor GLE1 [Ammoniphilus oxalaticus]|uniref:Nuclear export factor GLE1 n=1 Tax=Ammoniphilus oxalaticus TaxID=66863 RepID=A0A419SMT2_9BACL|nr:YcnI family protein [Ammoniphilus oxalaticus]RKD25553.1 nuclear export factor GLE1 [Ammoniphilus oxalaticus]